MYIHSLRQRASACTLIFPQKQFFGGEAESGFVCIDRRRCLKATSKVMSTEYEATGSKAVIQVETPHHRVCVRVHTRSESEARRIVTIQYDTMHASHDDQSSLFASPSSRLPPGYGKSDERQPARKSSSGRRAWRDSPIYMIYIAAGTVAYVRCSGMPPSSGQ